MLTPAISAWAGWTASAVAWEIHHRRRVGRVPHRILVGGMRGKSTAVRLLYAGFMAAGTRALARVTGDEPLMILPDGSERPVRRVGPPNIREMRRATRLAAQLGCDALCFENMAIRPELLRAVATHCILPTCSLFTFDGEDHGEVYPADAAMRAEMLAQAIPPEARLVLCQSTRNEPLAAALSRRRVEFQIAPPAEIPQLYPHMRAILGAVRFVMERCDIELTSEVGAAMEAAAAELQRVPSVDREGVTIFDLLSANDPDSVRELIAALAAEGRLTDPCALLFAHRRDRPRRLEAFAPLLREFESVVLGDPVPQRYLRRNGLRYSAKIDESHNFAPHSSVLLVGNARGAGALLRSRFLAASDPTT